MGNDLRSALQSAVESGKVSASPAAAAPAPASPAPVSPEGSSGSGTGATVPAAGRDAAGRFAGKGAASGAAVAATDSTSAPQGAGTESAPSTGSVPKPTSPALKPPQAWGVKVREKWDSLDPEVREEIAKRERDVANKIREEGEYRRFRDSLKPYETVIGQDPQKGILGLLQKEAAFRNATPQQRAQILGDMVLQGQIPVEALDQYLAGKLGGQAPQGQAPAIYPEAIVRQAEERVAAKIQQAMTQRQAAKAQADIAAFGEAHEFFADVQDTMAGLIEAGIAKDLATAYDKAILLNPDVREVVEQRKAAEAARGQNASTAQAKAAAMSVRSSPVATAGPAPTSLRDQLAAQVAAAGRR